MPNGGYYLTAEPVGQCSCHDCTCPGCSKCDPPEPGPCPECAAGKHPNCDGTSWDTHRDERCLCPCAEAGHGQVDVQAVVQLLRHRVRGHQAALRVAEELNHPLRLRDHEAETRARLAEAMTILAELEGWQP